MTIPPELLIPSIAALLGVMATAIGAMWKHHTKVVAAKDEEIRRLNDIRITEKTRDGERLLRVLGSTNALASVALQTTEARRDG